MSTVAQIAPMLPVTTYLLPGGLRVRSLTTTQGFAIPMPAHPSLGSQQHGMPDDKCESRDPNGQSLRTVTSKRSRSRTSNQQKWDAAVRQIDVAAARVQLRNSLI